MDGPSKGIRRFIACGIIALLFEGHAGAQKNPNSPVLRSYVPPQPPSLVKHFDEDRVLWEDFMLMRKANEGDAIAEHELGLRYFFGEGFPSDTARAAYWIQKAADQNLMTARFNYGILLNNGWGVPWNPFAAYLNFLFAAQQGMADAEFAVGTFFTDNLVVPRNAAEACCWVQAAADSGYKPAVQMLPELEERGCGGSGSAGRTDASPDSGGPSGTLGLVYLDFGSDTVAQPTDTTLIKDLFDSGSEKMKRFRQISTRPDSLAAGDSTLLNAVRDAAESGSPEALTLLGRWYAEGKAGHPAPLKAAVEYLRAVRWGSPQAAQLLWKLVHQEGFLGSLKSAIDAGDPEAKFIWAALLAYSFDHQLTDAQALEMLKQAAAGKHVQAIIELGLCYASGRWIKRNAGEAMALWKEASSLGSREAEIRLFVAGLMQERSRTIPRDRILGLQRASEDGSVLAEAALGYCYEIGLGMPRDEAQAVKLYRDSARRGNQTAYDQLKRMYDKLRPADREFHVE